MSLRDIDDLEAVADRNRQVRQAEARKAEGIIEQEIQNFAGWLGSLEVLPTIAALRTHATRIAEQVVTENAGKWDTASSRDLERVEAVAKAIVNRLLHDPTAAMKEMRDDRVHARMALVRDLFGLSVGEHALAAAGPPAAARPPAAGPPAAGPPAAARPPAAAAAEPAEDEQAQTPLPSNVRELPARALGRGRP